MSLTEEIFKNLINRENNHFDVINVDYMHKQLCFNSKMKTILVNWLIDVGNQ